MPTIYEAAERFIDGGIEVSVDGATLHFNRENGTLIDFKMEDLLATYNMITCGFQITSNLLDASIKTTQAQRAQMKQGCLVRPWLQPLEPAGDKKYLGYFYIDNLSISSDSIETTLTAYDGLYEFMNKDQASLDVGIYATVQELLEALFTALGLETTDYAINADLSTLPTGYYYLLEGKVKGTLQALMEAFSLAFYFNVDGILVVDYLTAHSNTAYGITDAEQIYALRKASKEAKRTYSEVLCNYYTHAPSAIVPIMNLNKYRVDANGSPIVEQNYDKYPVYNPVYAEVQGYYGYNIVNVNDFTFHRTYVSIEIGAADQQFDITVYGECLERTAGSYIKAVNYGNDDFTATETLKIENIMIQTRGYAETWATKRATELAVGNHYLELDTRGNALIGVLDAVSVSTAEVSASGYLLGQVYEYNGALSATMQVYVPDGITFKEV